MMEAADVSKTRDYITRDLVFVTGTGAPPAGVLPWTRYNYVKVKPGKGGDYRKVWEKYNKPVLDKLVADGTVLAYGLAVEEVRTDGDFTHFVWYATKTWLHSKSCARRSWQTGTEEPGRAGRDYAEFLKTIEPDASRSEVAGRLCSR